MDRELFNILSRHEALNDEQLDSKRMEMVGEGLGELSSEWFNMVEFSYNIGQYEEVLSIDELGATTSIIIVCLDKDDIDDPFLEDEELLESMMKQTDYVGEIARIIKIDDSVHLDSAGIHPRREDQVSIEVWA